MRSADQVAEEMLHVPLFKIRMDEPRDSIECVGSVITYAVRGRDAEIADILDIIIARDWKVDKGTGRTAAQLRLDELRKLRDELRGKK